MSCASLTQIWYDQRIVPSALHTATTALPFVPVTGTFSVVPSIAGASTTLPEAPFAGCCQTIWALAGTPAGAPEASVQRIPSCT